jgi:hypothetical protein
MKTTDTTDRRVRQRDRAVRTRPRARSRILGLPVLIPLGKRRMEVCRPIKGRFRARRLVRRVFHRLLEERLLAIMLDAAPRMQNNSSSNDKMMKLHGTVK